MVSKDKAHAHDLDKGFEGERRREDDLCLVDQPVHVRLIVDAGTVHRVVNKSEQH